MIALQELEPERELWSAVLQVAILDLGRTKHLRTAALNWFTSGEQDIGGFRWVCGQLQLEWVAVQERLLRNDQEITFKLKRARGAPKTKAKTDLNTGESSFLIVDNKDLRKLSHHGIFSLSPKKERRKMDDGKDKGRDNVIELLRRQAERFQGELAAAEAMVQKLGPVVAHLQAALAALVDPAKPPKPAPKITRSTLAPMIKHNGQSGAAKHKRETLPALQKSPLYKDRSIVDALKIELAKSHEPVHYDELTRRIFAVSDDQLGRAKSSCSSTLVSGSKKGLWKALGAGKYAFDSGAPIP